MRRSGARPVLIVVTACLAAAVGCVSSPPPTNTLAMNTPIVIAHRGASGHLPEHTLEAYALAIEMGADYIEPDLVSTKDGVLIARHENEIGGTTDVAQRFPARRRRAVIDGDSVDGWFTEDFTWAEIQTLRAKERLPQRSHANDGRFAIPRFDQVLALVRREERARGRTIGIYPETKHPTYFRELGLPLEAPLLASLARHGYEAATDAVFIQSFETENLRALSAQTKLPLIQLIDEAGRPYDLSKAGDARTYRDLITPTGLADIARYARGIGVAKALVHAASERAPMPSVLVRDAHAAGLLVHVWTLRSDAPFLASSYNGVAAAEWRRFAELGVDGMFGDFPDVGVAALKSRP